MITIINPNLINLRLIPLSLANFLAKGDALNSNFELELLLEKKISVSDFEKLRKGVLLQKKACSIKKIDYVIGGTKKEIGVEVDNLSPAVLVKMFEKINHKVFFMDRVMYASLTKKDLPRGRWRNLSEREIQLLHLIAH